MCAMPEGQPDPGWGPMSSRPVQNLHPLHLHPASAWQLRARLEAGCALLTTSGLRDSERIDPFFSLVLHYRLCGEWGELHLPAPQPAGPADGLWQSTCFEAFVGHPGESAYQEFNFAPCGRWAHYRFQRERQRDTDNERQDAGPSAPRFVWSHTADAIHLQVVLPLQSRPTTGWQVGLCAVLAHQDGRLAFAALHHPRDVPDFHHPAGRILCLP